MYTVVMMAALATSPSTPAWCHGCCHSCCHSYCCSSYCCCSCYGCHGCCGGWGCYGCCCYGGHGCCCYGYCCSSYGCCGGWGYGCCSYGCCSYGCCGGWGCCGGGYYGGVAAPVYGTMPAAEPTPAPKKEGKKDGEVSAPAKLVVEVPADATLYIDDQAMKTAADKRSFNTPALQPGQAYFYDLRAEVVRDGKTYTETKRVIVKAGETAHATFPELTTAGAAAAGKPVAAR